MCPLDMVSPKLNYAFRRKITPSSGLKEMNVHMSRKNRESRVPTSKLSSKTHKVNSHRWPQERARGAPAVRGVGIMPLCWEGALR